MSGKIWKREEKKNSPERVHKSLAPPNQVQGTGAEIPFDSHSVRLSCYHLQGKGLRSHLGPKKTLSPVTAYWPTKMLPASVGIIFIGTVSALFKLVFLRRNRYTAGVVATKPLPNSNNVITNEILLTKHQLELLGVKPKVDLAQPDSSKKPP
ncbi:hypothetical protein VNO77_42167 [Canavalia gladiata]|uniref:Uncharacterized protein n=1 Tax=Canavalia gladiata TaxID=3824 RepID=A0AAN9PT55_CANGL